MSTQDKFKKCHVLTGYPEFDPDKQIDVKGKKIADSKWRGVIDDKMFKEQLSDRAIALWLKEETDEPYTVTQVKNYRKQREEEAQFILDTIPEYQAYKMAVREEMNNSLMAMRNVDLIGALTTVMGDSAKMIADANERGVKIKDAKEYRMIQQSLLDTIKLYGEMMILNQKYEMIQKQQENPEQFRPQNNTININIKGALSDILKEAVKEGDYTVVDAMRDVIDIPEASNGSEGEE